MLLYKDVITSSFFNPTWSSMSLGILLPLEPVFPTGLQISRNTTDSVRLYISSFYKFYKTIVGNTVPGSGQSYPW